MKRFIIAFIAAYVFIFVWGWLLNGVLLKDVYAQTPNLWRSQSEMMSLFHWILIGQALVIFAFVMIYACGSLAAAWLPESVSASWWKLQRSACVWPFTQSSRSPQS
jgi:hypothetical protein